MAFLYIFYGLYITFLYIFYGLFIHFLLAFCFSKDGKKSKYYIKRHLPFNRNKWGIPNFAKSQKTALGHVICKGIDEGKPCTAIWKQENAEYLSKCKHFWACWDSEIDNLLLRNYFYNLFI